MSLNIGRGTKGKFVLPTDIAVETNSLMGQRGSGKTYTAQVMAEEMFHADIQIVVVDPLDVWYGLKSAADGKGPGLPVVVMGGFKGDIPLEPDAGKIIADFIVENPTVSVILSLRDMSKGKQLQFVADFATELYHRKGNPAHRNPLHLFIDEADRYAPQHTFPESKRTLGAVDDLVRRGRSSGIGVTLITQRAAVINKDVMSQTSTLICLKTTGPHDRAALKSWIEANDPGDHQKLFMDSLASLSVGEAWYWNPGQNIFEKIQTRKKTTFDSSSTPKIGELRIEPKLTAAVDLVKLKASMATTLEVAKKNDPKMLRSEVETLKAKLNQKEQALAAMAAIPADHQVLKDAEQRGYEKGFNEGIEAAREYVNIDLTGTLKEICDKASEEFESMKIKPNPHGGSLSRMAAAAGYPAEDSETLPRTPVPDIKVNYTVDPVPGLSKCERAVLNVLRFQSPLSKGQLAVKTLYAVSSGNFNNSLGHLRSVGLIEGGGDAIKLVKVPQDAVDLTYVMPTRNTLVGLWQNNGLTKCEREVLGVLLTAGALSKADLAHRTGYAASSGNFNNSLGHLRSLGLITKGSSIKLSDYFL